MSILMKMKEKPSDAQRVKEGKFEIKTDFNTTTLKLN